MEASAGVPCDLLPLALRAGRGVTIVKMVDSAKMFDFAIALGVKFPQSVLGQSGRNV